MARWVEVPGAPGLAPGGMCAVAVGDAGILLARCEDGWHAIEDRCSHDDGPLGEGRLVGCEVECPRHGARFDVRDGRVTRMPAVSPVRSFPVREEGGRVFVDAEAL